MAVQGSSWQSIVAGPGPTPATTPVHENILRIEESQTESGWRSDFRPEMMAVHILVIHMLVRILGRLDAMRLHAATLGQSWVRGVRNAERIYSA
jgi:hypothetical protein